MKKKFITISDMVEGTSTFIKKDYDYFHSDSYQQEINNNNTTKEVDIIDAFFAMYA